MHILSKHKATLTKLVKGLGHPLAEILIPSIAPYNQIETPYLSNSSRGRRGWFVYPEPQHFWWGSWEAWLLSCQSWSSDGSCTVCPPSRKWRQWHWLVNTIDSIFCSLQCKQTKPTAACFHWGQKSCKRPPESLARQLVAVFCCMGQSMKTRRVVCFVKYAGLNSENQGKSRIEQRYSLNKGIR